jgi:NADH:ubiquinone oxidoreductase subunit K
LSNETKASFVLGAIGGFLIALIYSPSFLGLPSPSFLDRAQHYLLLILGLILITIGFLGLWRKSGNVIPLVSAICILVWDIIVPLLYFLIGLPDTRPDWFPIIFSTVGWIFISVGWITAGYSAWLLREEFSQFSIVAALVLLACGAMSWPLALIGGGWNIWVSLLWAVTGIVAVIYFLDAART